MTKFNKFFYRAIIKLSNYTICEHALEYKVVQNKVTDKAPTIGKHIIKLFLYNTNGSTNHWIHEIQTRLSEIFDLDVKNGIELNSENYMELLWELPWNEKPDRKYVALLNAIDDEYADIRKYKVNRSLDEIKEIVKITIFKLSSLINDYYANKDEIDKILRSL